MKKGKKKYTRKEYMGHDYNGAIYVDRGLTFEEFCQETDTCFLCLGKVKKNEWRKHMDEFHHVVNHPMFEQVKKSMEEHTVTTTCVTIPKQD